MTRKLDRRDFLAITAASCLSACSSVSPRFQNQVLDRNIENLELILHNVGDDKYLNRCAPHAVIGNHFSFLTDITFEGELHYVFIPAISVPQCFGTVAAATVQDAVNDLTSIAKQTDLECFALIQARVAASPYGNALVPGSIVVPWFLLKKYDTIKYVQKFPSVESFDQDAEVEVSLSVSEVDAQLLFYGAAWQRQSLRLPEYGCVSSSVRELAHRISDPYPKLEHKAQVLLNFVQSFSYLKDPQNGLDVPRFPLATLLIRGGDCEDTSLLYSGLLSAVGIYHALIVTPGPPGHVLVGVAGDFTGYSVSGYGGDLFTAETTMLRSSIGEAQTKNISMCYPMNII